MELDNTTRDIFDLWREMYVTIPTTMGIGDNDMVRIEKLVDIIKTHYPTAHLIKENFDLMTIRGIPLDVSIEDIIKIVNDDKPIECIEEHHSKYYITPTKETDTYHKNTWIGIYCTGYKEFYIAPETIVPE